MAGGQKELDLRWCITAQPQCAMDRENIVLDLCNEFQTKNLKVYSHLAFYIDMSSKVYVVMCYIDFHL